MNQKSKFDANEKRQMLFEAADWCCCVCGKPLRSGVPQLAHRVIRSKYHVKTYGSAIIDNSLNLVPVCSLNCNSRVIVNFQPARDLLVKIQLINAGMEMGPDLAEHYRELREYFKGLKI
jgi:hypothetical protein